MIRHVLTIIAALATLVPMRAFAMGVSPGIIDLAARRGEVIDSELTVSNDTNRSHTYFLSTLKFAARENSSSPEFIPYAQDHSGFPEWISIPQASIQLKAGERKTVPFSVAVPLDAEAGAQYAAIVVSDAPRNVATTAGGISTSVASLVFLNVAGETTQKLAIMDFLGTGGDVRLRIQNQGNTYLVPKVRMAASNMFGKEVWSKDFTETDHRVLPGQTSSYEGSVELTSLAFGPISVVAEVSANPSTSSGQTGGVERREYRYSVWPKELAGIVAALCVVLVLGLLLRLRALRKTHNAL